MADTRKIKVIVQEADSEIGKELIRALIQSENFEVVPLSLVETETGEMLPDLAISLFPKNIWENIDIYKSKQIPFVIGASLKEMNQVADKIASDGAINAVVMLVSKRDLVGSNRDKCIARAINALRYLFNKEHGPYASKEKVDKVYDDQSLKNMIFDDWQRENSSLGGHILKEDDALKSRYNETQRKMQND